MKSFIKKVTSPSPFKGQGHVLGSASTSSSPTTSTTNSTSHPPTNPIPRRPPPSPSSVEASATNFLSDSPPDAAVEVVKKLLGNLVREPSNEKYWRIRMTNPKIKDAVADRSGGIELLEAAGFQLGEDSNGELFAAMEAAPEEALVAEIRLAVLMLERWQRQRQPTLPQEETKAADAASVAAKIAEGSGEPKKMDRQVRVFVSGPKSADAEGDLPDSFYELSNAEIRREANMRKERLEQSRLLIPKSYKEKQALAARQKYKQTVVRIQFPDGVILQGVFRPWEATTVLYEFVAAALKEPSLEFELLYPSAPKPRLVPHFQRPGGRTPTLEEEDLVPSVLLKFKPEETDAIVFTGLVDELLEASEPLTSAT